MGTPCKDVIIGDYARGDICVYYKNHLPRRFLPELTDIVTTVSRD